MGAEIVCTARFGEKTAKGKARLEADTLQFSGPDVRVSIRFEQIAKVTARGGVLAVESSHGRLSLALGDAAAKWRAGNFGARGNGRGQSGRSGRRQSGELLADAHRREVRHSGQGAPLTFRSATTHASRSVASSRRSRMKRAGDAGSGMSRLR